MAKKKISQVDKYEMLYPVLNTLQLSINELSKKKPDGAMNKLKVQMANKILSQAKELLSDEPEVQFLEILDDEILPSYSDSLLIISQYKTVMDKFKQRNTVWKGSKKEWIID